MIGDDEGDEGDDDDDGDLTICQRQQSFRNAEFNQNDPF